MLWSKECLLLLQLVVISPGEAIHAMWSTRRQNWETGGVREIIWCCAWRWWGRRPRLFSLVWAGLPSASVSFTWGAATKITLFGRSYVAVRPWRRAVCLCLCVGYHFSSTLDVGYGSNKKVWLDGSNDWMFPYCRKIGLTAGHIEEVG